MTLVGLEYLAHQENVRKNKAQEALTIRGQDTVASTADKDRSSREGIATLDRMSRESIASLDRSSREDIASLDRQSRESIASQDRMSRENIASADRTSKESIATADRESRETIADKDRAQSDRKLREESRLKQYEITTNAGQKALDRDTNRQISDKNREADLYKHEGNLQLEQDKLAETKTNNDWNHWLGLAQTVTGGIKDIASGAGSVLSGIGSLKGKKKK